MLRSLSLQQISILIPSDYYTVLIFIGFHGHPCTRRCPYLQDLGFTRYDECQPSPTIHFFAMNETIHGAVSFLFMALKALALISGSGMSSTFIFSRVCMADPSVVVLNTLRTAV